MKTLLKSTLLVAIGTALIAAPAWSSGKRSSTLAKAGLNYKLTFISPFKMGDQTMWLRVSRRAEILKDVKLTAVVTMGDGMSSPVTVTSKPNGELELKTKFTMSGNWQLKIEQSAPVKVDLQFPLQVKK